MKVRNINGTSDNTCKCKGGWLGHWEKFSKQKPGLCCEKNCTESATLGAHVQKEDVKDQSWYIVPFCDKHNKKADELDLYGSPTLISANVKETCGN